MNRAGGLSLNTRLLIAASVVLAAFLGLTGLTLDEAFRESALAAVREQLKVQIYSLLAAAELDDREKLAVPKRPPEVRLDTPGSGLYAQVNDAAG
ncbi:MAG: ATP-binding protein, partial [Gammaproteobacteria bacterium]